MILKILVGFYEKFRQKCHQDPVDRLRALGAEIGDNVHIYDGGGSSIDYSFSHLLKIGNNVTITNSTILMHDASIKKELKFVKVGKVVIGNDVFVGAGTLILPNVTIGDKVVIGAGSVVSKSIPDGVVAVGNPIRIIGTYDNYVKKCSEILETRPCFSQAGLDDEKERMKREIEDWGVLR